MYANTELSKTSVLCQKRFTLLCTHTQTCMHARRKPQIHLSLPFWQIRILFQSSLLSHFSNRCETSRLDTSKSHVHLRINHSKQQECRWGPRSTKEPAIQSGWFNIHEERGFGGCTLVYRDLSIFFFFVPGIRFDIPTCRWYLHMLLFGLNVIQKRQRRQAIDVQQRALAGVLQTISGFLTKLMIISDWGKVSFGAWESRSSSGKTKAKCSLWTAPWGGKREVAGNQSNTGRKDCRAQAQVFRTNRLCVPLLSAWQWCDRSTKIRSTASNGWHLLHKLCRDWVQKTKQKTKQVGSPLGEKKIKNAHLLFLSLLSKGMDMRTCSSVSAMHLQTALW